MIRLVKKDLCETMDLRMCQKNLVCDRHRRVVLIMTNLQIMTAQTQGFNNEQVGK